MAEINWGLAGGNAFTNAFQVGAALGQRVRQRDADNALAAYVADRQGNAMGGGQGIAATPEQQAESQRIRETFMRRDPVRFAQIEQQNAQLEQQRSRAAVEAAKARQAGIPQVIGLLKGSTDQASYEQNVRTARTYGIDTSGLPAQFSPQWRDQQVATLEMLSSPQGQEAFSTAGKQAMDEGFRNGTPEFANRVREIWQLNNAKPYTDATGATRLYIPGGQQQAATPQRQAQATPKPSGLTDDQIWSQAHEAVRNGANADEVFRRLQSWGMQP